MIRLKELRLKNGLTQAQMAKNFAITVTQYQRYENGKSNPRVEDLIHLADFFGVSVDYLLDREPTKTPYSDLSDFQILFNQLTETEKAAVKNLMESLIQGR